MKTARVRRAASLARSSRGVRGREEGLEVELGVGVDEDDGGEEEEDEEVAGGADDS